MEDDFAVRFLPWLRDATNERWANMAPAAVEDARHWGRGTRWRGGMAEAEIEAAERRFGLRFPTDYRAFLAMLHTPDPPAAGAGPALDRPNPDFTDWTGDPERIREAMAWPVDGLLWSIEADDGWCSAWGPRPATAEGRERRVRELAEAGPQLVPVFGHRYLAGAPDRSGNPVLSIYGADVVFYGRDLEDYLRNELFPPAPGWHVTGADASSLGVWADVMAGFDDLRGRGI